MQFSRSKKDLEIEEETFGGSLEEKGLDTPS
jgi:hypothetical protein